MNIGLKEAHVIAIKSLPGYNVKVSAEIGKGYSWEDEGLRWTITATTEGNDVKLEQDPVFTIALARLSAELSRVRATEIKEVVVEETPEPTPESVEETEVF